MRLEDRPVLVRPTCPRCGRPADTLVDDLFGDIDLPFLRIEHDGVNEPCAITREQWRAVFAEFHALNAGRPR